MFKTLEEFAVWYLDKGSFKSIKPPYKSVYNYGVVISTVLYRSGPFQAELFLIPANSNIVLNEHGHPNVDSYEVYQSGEILFTLEGNQVVSNEDAKAITPEGTSTMLNTVIRVYPSVRHGATVGPEGGSFLSLQHWINNVSPTSVGLDWEGAPGSNFQEPAPVINYDRS